MKKRLLSLFLAFVTLLGILPTAALAANTEEEALGEVDIYNGGYELSYLTINGRIRTQDYTYFNYVDAKGQKKEVPAYCVNPNIKGVPQTVGVGESIKYLANERSSDPKVVGIISNGYPHRSLGELKLDNKYQAYYATKMALWCYLLPNWNIANLKVAPGLTGSELDIGNRILAAAKDIYKRGTTYNYMLEPRMTATPDKSATYSVTVDGKQYKQQVFTIWSETWVYDYDNAAWLHGYADALTNVADALEHQQELMDSIIGCMGEQYDSAELYDILHNALAMSDKDILSLGFELPQCHEYDTEISTKRPKGRKFALYER